MSLTIDEIIDLNNRVHEVCGWGESHCLDIGYNVLEKGDLILYFNVNLNVLDDNLVNSIPELYERLREACRNYAENIKIHDDFEDSPSGYLVAIVLDKEANLIREVQPGKEKTEEAEG